MTEPYYTDEFVTLYHGDCREILPTISGVGLVVTSPPYNLGTTTGGGFPASGGLWKNPALSDGYDGHDDAMPVPEYEEWQRVVLSELWGSLDDGGAIFYNHKPRVQAGVLWTPLALVPEGVILRQIIVWTRGGGMNFAPTHFVPTHEWVMVLAKPAWRLKSKGVSGLGDVWHLPAEASEHPAPFPIGIPARAIEATPDGLVLDPFAGSGTTLRAAKDAGRKAIGIEKSERYCELIVKRLGQGVLDFGGVA